MINLNETMRGDGNVDGLHVNTVGRRGCKSQ